MNSNNMDEGLLTILSRVENLLIKVLSKFHAGKFSSPVLGRTRGISGSPRLSEGGNDSPATVERILETIGEEPCAPLDRLSLSLSLGREERFIILLLPGFQLVPGWRRYAAAVQSGNGLRISNYLISVITTEIFGDNLFLPRLLDSFDFRIDLLREARLCEGSLPDGLRMVFAELQMPSREERLDLWRSALNGENSPAPEFLKGVVSGYRLTKSQILQVAGRESGILIME